MVYKFDKQLKDGEEGELYLDKYFREWFIVTPVNMSLQRKGIDRTFLRKSNSERITVEYKKDTKARQTNNLFIETVSIDNQDKPGWAVYSEADILVSYIPPMKIIITPMSIIKSHLRLWTDIYPEKVIPNMGYNTLGICVPIREIEKYHLNDFITSDILKLPKGYSAINSSLACINDIWYWKSNDGKEVVKEIIDIKNGLAQVGSTVWVYIVNPYPNIPSPVIYRKN